MSMFPRKYKQASRPIDPKGPEQQRIVKRNRITTVSGPSAEQYSSGNSLSRRLELNRMVSPAFGRQQTAFSGSLAEQIPSDDYSSRRFESNRTDSPSFSQRDESPNVERERTSTTNEILSRDGVNVILLGKELLQNCTATYSSTQTLEELCANLTRQQCNIDLQASFELIIDESEDTNELIKYAMAGQIAMSNQLSNSILQVGETAQTKIQALRKQTIKEGMGKGEIATKGFDLFRLQSLLGGECHIPIIGEVNVLEQAKKFRAGVEGPPEAKALKLFSFVLNEVFPPDIRHIFTSQVESGGYNPLIYYEEFSEKMKKILGCTLGFEEYGIDSDLAHNQYGWLEAVMQKRADSIFSEARKQFNAAQKGKVAVEGYKDFQSPAQADAARKRIEHNYGVKKIAKNKI